MGLVAGVVCAFYTNPPRRTLGVVTVAGLEPASRWLKASRSSN